MSTRCKCCNLPENIQNSVNELLLKKVSYRGIVASINPMLESSKKLTINNLCVHRKHIVDRVQDPNTGLVMSDANLYFEMRRNLKEMTLHQCKLILETL